jgi:hypothetical protein
MLTDFGKPINPSELNAWLRKAGGYHKTNLFVWRAIHPLGVRLRQLFYCYADPAPMELIRQALAAGEAVIVQVDMSPGGEVQPHWVRVLALLPDGVQIMDPWQPHQDEAIVLLEDHYCKAGWDAARAILTVAIYRNLGESDSLDDQRFDEVAI